MGVLAAPEERQEAYVLLMAAAHVGLPTGEQPAQVALLPAPPVALPAQDVAAPVALPAQEAAAGGALPTQDATAGGAVAPQILGQDATPAQDTTVAVASHMPAQAGTPAQDSRAVADSAAHAWRTARPPDQQPAPLPGLLTLLK